MTEKPITGDDIFRSAPAQTTRRKDDFDEDACYRNCVHAGGNRELCFRFCYMQPHLSTTSTEVAG